MLDRQHGDVIFECDGGCGEVLETGTSNFDAARNALRRENWKTRKIGEEWTHLCPGCYERL